MRIVAIGATGFIGRHVVSSLLREGHAVAVFHRGTTALPLPVTEILGERSTMVASRGEFQKFKPDVVIDMILSSGAQARETLAAFRGIARRVVAASSGDAYRAMAILHRADEGPLEPVPLTEESTLRTTGVTYSPAALERARTFYPWVDAEYDKVQVERAFAADAEMPATILRLPMVYGPGDPLHRLYPVVKRMADGRPAIVLEEGLATWVACRGYVENVADAIALAATAAGASGRIYNVAEAEAYDELTLASKVAAAMGWQGRIVVLPREMMPAHLLVPYNVAQSLYMDSCRIRRELGYAERVSLEEAIRRTVEWERENPPAQLDPALWNYAAEDAVI